MLRLLFVLTCTVVLLAMTVQTPVPGVFSWPIAACEVDYYIDQRVLALACPGHDMLRLWPLPPQSPWFEDDSLPTHQKYERQATNLVHTHLAHSRQYGDCEDCQRYESNSHPSVETVDTLIEASVRRICSCTSLSEYAVR